MTTSALILAGGILACTLVACLMVWDVRQRARRDEWWAGVLRFRAENAALATGTLQLEYAPQAPGGRSMTLCWSGTPGGRFGGHDGTGVHLTTDERITLCGRTVIDVPLVPRSIEPLSCVACHEAPSRSGTRSSGTSS